MARRSRKSKRTKKLRGMSDDLFEKAAQQAVEEGAGGLGLDVGIHTCKLKEIQIGKSKSSGKPMSTWIWIKVDEDGKGDIQKQYFILNDVDAIARMNKQLIRMGYEDSIPETQEQMYELADELKDDDIVARLQVTEGTGGNTWINLKKVLDDFEDEDLDEDEDEDDDEDYDDEDEDEDEEPRRSRRRKGSKKSSRKSRSKKGGKGKSRRGRSRRS